MYQRSINIIKDCKQNFLDEKDLVFRGNHLHFTFLVCILFTSEQDLFRPLQLARWIVFAIVLMVRVRRPIPHVDDQLDHSLAMQATYLHWPEIQGVVSV